MLQSDLKYTDNVAVLLLCEVPMETSTSGPMVEILHPWASGPNADEAIAELETIASCWMGWFNPELKDARCLHKDLAGVMMVIQLSSPFIVISNVPSLMEAKSPSGSVSLRIGTNSTYLFFFSFHHPYLTPLTPHRIINPTNPSSSSHTT